MHQNSKLRTLFSDFILSFLNTRFLSVKPSEAIDEKPKNEKEKIKI
jgi:hypothetical protein